MTLVGRALRRAGRTLGYDGRDVMSRLCARDPRWPTFCHATEYIDYEGVPGDIVEFGVFTGISLALLAKAHSFGQNGVARTIAGFDSFAGLPDSGDAHARWRPGDCASNHSWHPLLQIGDRVTPDVTRRLFEICLLEKPVLHVGPFEQTLAAAFPTAHPAVALVHFDCDLYESTRDALTAIAPSLQDGSILLFDDWFHYRGHPGRGEARAFTEFLETHSEWGAVQYQPYATFCNSFIVHRR